MIDSKYIVAILLLTIFSLSYIHYTLINESHKGNHMSIRSKQELTIESVTKHYTKIIEQQNNTINLLKDAINSNNGTYRYNNTMNYVKLLDQLKEQEVEISLLLSQLDFADHEAIERNIHNFLFFPIMSTTAATIDPTLIGYNVSSTDVSAIVQYESKEYKSDVKLDTLSPKDSYDSFRHPYHKHDALCDQRYGWPLIDAWRNSKTLYCTDDDVIGQSLENKAEIYCYPHKQDHKSGYDTFCEATNIFLDFNKITGSHSKNKPTAPNQYLTFGQGSTFSRCKKTSEYRNNVFMNHHAKQMRAFQDNIRNQDISADYKVINTTTYLLARDEDCENTFHSTADFMNMYLVMQALSISPSEQQVILFDRYPDGPYIELIKEGFSKNYPVLRANHFQGVVLFKRLIFHLESPAALIFPKVTLPDPGILTCYNTKLFDAYRKHVLSSFNLYDVAPSQSPTVTLILRHRTANKNVGRIMANEKEVIDAIYAADKVNINIVDTATLTYREQLSLIRNSNVLIGIHGAGLMMIMFAADEAVLIEIHPTYRLHRHFRHAARMTGKIYMPLRAVKKETCEGTSDNVFVPIDEFKATLDGAVRIARSFDDGLAECGLKCSSTILSYDTKHSSSTQPVIPFPCQ